MKHIVSIAQWIIGAPIALICVLVILYENFVTLRSLRMKRIALVFAVLAAIAGCHAQVPPATGYKVALTWTAPTANSSWTGCTTSAPCVYAVYRCVGSSATCSNTAATNWSELTTSATRPSGTAYTDVTVASGVTAYYTVETVQASSNSAASNVVNFAVPGVPTAPALSNPTTAMIVKPALLGPVPSASVYAMLTPPGAPVLHVKRVE